jgi:uncharacterized protein
MKKPVFTKTRVFWAWGLFLSLAIFAVNAKPTPPVAATPQKIEKVEAPHDLVAQAEAGSIDAQFDLGRRYLNGEGAPHDEAEGARWILKAAEAGSLIAQKEASRLYREGVGVDTDPAQAFFWQHKAAEQGDSEAEYEVGLMYRVGQGVMRDFSAASHWARRAAEQGHVQAQYYLGTLYANGQGVPLNDREAARWFRYAALQGDANAQLNLGIKYDAGKGVRTDYIEAYKWLNLAAAQGNTTAMSARDKIVRRMTPEQIDEAQRRSTAFVPQPGMKPALENVAQLDPDSPIEDNGTGFFITDDGFLLTAYHIIIDAQKVGVKRNKELLSARVIKVDPVNDLALLKVNGQFKAAALASTRNVKIGDAIFTLGFPSLKTPATDPHLVEGNIKMLSGPQDNPRFFQINLPLQLGNNGGPLFDAAGSVVAMIDLPGDTVIPKQNEAPVFFNALKSSYALAFLESVPQLVGLLKPPAATAGRKFEELVKEAKESVVLVLAF